MAMDLGPGRGGGRRRFANEPMSQINVTPMVDVMLVLLIVFMVTAPLLTVGVPVELPKTDAAQLATTEEPLVVTVNRDGSVFLEDTEVVLEDLPAKLRAIQGANADTTIYVRGDRSILYGRVMEVMGSLAAAGFQKVSLVAELPQSGAK